MIDFKKELERFRPMLDVEHIEDRIGKDDMQDLIDILKEFNHKEIKRPNQEDKQDF